MQNKRLLSLPWREARRLRSFDLVKKGWRRRLIAEAFDVSEAAVSQWCKAVSAQGRKALHTRPRPGAPARLTEDEQKLIPEFLWHGAEAYGFRGQLWTCDRIAKVIEQEFGVSYHPSHVARLLKKLGWTPQKPIKRASQRNEAEIRRWRTETWPLLKKKPAERGVR